MALPAVRSSGRLGRWDPFREFENLYGQLGRWMESVADTVDDSVRAWAPLTVRVPKTEAAKPRRIALNGK